MFKATVENGQCTVEMDGDVVLMAIETTRAVGAVYEGLKMAHPEDAELFKRGVIISLREDAPTWNAMERAKDPNAVVIVTTNKKGGAPTGQSQSTAD